MSAGFRELPFPAARWLVGRPQTYGCPTSTFAISNPTFGRPNSSFRRMLLFTARCDHTVTCLLGGWQDHFPPPTQSPAPLLSGRAFPPRPSFFLCPLGFRGSPV